MSTESVVGWANNLKKNLWWRHAIRLAAEKGKLEDKDLQLLLSIAKMECGLEDKNEFYESYVAPLDLTGFGEEKQAVRLKSIGNVNNVSALVSNAILEFQTEGLTAVYGDNGSGKSSYTKILKNACLTRGRTPQILPNIYGKETGTPSANISIAIGDDEHNIAWAVTNEAHEALKAIRIFDNTSAAHYVSDEDAIEYKPAGMKLLSQLIYACDFVRSCCESEKKSYLSATPLPEIRPDGAVFAFVSALSDKTEAKDVDALCLTKEEDDSIPVYREELAKLQTNTPEKLRKGYSDHRKGLQPLLLHLNKLKEKLGQENFDTIKRAYDDYKTKQGAAELARKQAIEGHDISGICSPEWKAMWSHVKSFVQAHNEKLAFPPLEGDPCPTCLQPVSGESAEKLKSFNDYLQDQTQVEAGRAKSTFEAYINDLKLLTFDLKPYELALSLIRDIKKEYADSIIELNSNLAAICSNLVKDEPDFTQVKVEFNVVDWINGQISSLKQKEEAIKTDEGLAKHITDLNKRIQELEQRKLFTSHKQNILKEIKRKKMLALFDDVISSCQSKQITAQTSAIARTGAIGYLQEAFRDELTKLGFQHFDVNTETRGSRGKQMLKLRLTGKENGITDVASEGEQKCVALAGFLAELVVDDRKSAIIFDDPINSLDHKWRRKFADRIAEEALSRQVIVFTHDMSFLKMLEEATGVAQSTLNVISIAKYGNLAGYPSAEPPWDAKNTLARVGELKATLPKLKKMEKLGDAQYEFHAKHIYNKMRETWERLVEEWLLRKVVERFARGVKTQSIKEIADDVTSKDCDIINAAMSKCSTYMHGHDNATDLAVDCPSYQEIEKDVTELEDYFKELKGRRK
ncbi:AAA family ATPase [Vibrio cholerae]|uniref:AAA family ATPase n=1 Tax=Vibrio cholerae TaxID=666 RepID=UPI0015587563|nr:AAA family ATPase [Vibrio cholerae]